MRPNTIGAISIVLAFTSSAPAAAQQPAYLVKDIHPGVDRSAGLGPQDLMVMGDALYFRGSDEFHGRELWRTDGTAAGTKLVADVTPPSGNIIALGGRRMMAARDRVYLLGNWASPFTLWVSDGTPSGTHAVTDVGNASLIAGVGSSVLFHASQAGGGFQIWVSDGTADGTRVLEPLRGASVGSYVSTGDLVYLNVGGGQPGLWRTDGTDAGTIRLTNTSHGGGVAIGNRLFFAGCDAIHGCEPWTSDGTPAGTRRIGDVWPGVGGSFPYGFAMAGSTVFFGARDSDGQALWKTDLTGSSVTIVKRVAVVHGFGAGANGSYFFMNGADLRGNTLWKSDGTEQGTQFVADLPDRPEGGDVSFGPLVAGSSFVAFTLSGYDGNFVQFHELWRSDGTESGTFPIFSVDEPIEELTSALGRIFFRAAIPASGRELWSTDGTIEGTGMVLDFAPAANAWPWNLTSAGSYLFALAESTSDGATEPEAAMWRTDGTAAGTLTVAEFEGASFYDPLPGSDRAFFTKSSPDRGLQLWSTDGTAEGSTLLSDFVQTVERHRHDSMTTLYFSRRETASWQLWKSDGTAAGTSLVTTFGPNVNQLPHGFRQIDDRVYFSLCTTSEGCEPWITDGSSAGTRLIKDLIPGTPSSFASSFVPLQGQTLFLAWSLGRAQLWKTDGSESGTSIVREFDGMPIPHAIASLPDRVVFAVGYSGSGSREELWSSTGTAEGTTRIAQFPRAPFNVGSLIGLGDVLLFMVDDGTHGREWWKTNGTAEGTALLKDLYTGSRGFAGYGFDSTAVTGLRLVFTGADDEHGYEVFVTDGSSDGTRVLADINPGSESSHAYELEIAGPRLFIAAGRPDVGFELVAMVLAPADALDDLAQNLDELGLPHGTVSSLKAKLQAASRAIDAGAPGTAINVLQAFITEVNALREKKISAADAEALIAAAVQILEAL